MVASGVSTDLLCEFGCYFWPSSCWVCCPALLVLQELCNILLMNSFLLQSTRVGFCRWQVRTLSGRHPERMGWLPKYIISNLQGLSSSYLVAPTFCRELCYSGIKFCAFRDTAACLALVPASSSSCESPALFNSLPGFPLFCDYLFSSMLPTLSF